MSRHKIICMCPECIERRVNVKIAERRAIQKASLQREVPLEPYTLEELENPSPIKWPTQANFGQKLSNALSGLPRPYPCIRDGQLVPFPVNHPDIGAGR